MSNNASRNGNTKRAVLPKQLDKLDVALEREKSVKNKQTANSSNSNQNSNAPSPETNSGVQAREKSPTKQQPRASINKVAVAASNGASASASSTPMKRPASAPVKPTAKNAAAASVKPVRASVASASSKNDAKKSLAAGKDHARAGSSSNLAQQSDDEAVEADERGGGTPNDALADEEPPARGHYDIFIQTRACEDLCRSLGLTLQHIRKMKKKYDANDMYCTGEITQAEFFFMINEEERPISKGIFKFGGIAKDQKYISFDQYLLCVVHFASLTKPELFQFVFDLYDDDQSGSLDEREFTKMSKELQSKQFCFPKNVETAIKMLGGADGGRGVGTEDGLVDIAQFMRFARKFPVAFYPIANMQKNIRAATLGESFWSHIVARQLKIQGLLSHMRRNYGAVPEMTTRERVWSFFCDDVFYVRKRAAELYATEVAHRRQIGDID